tara:strand:+ start:8414 stop:10207 length:1794 start_codon:yes stop_codon:yes gene_type:complete
MGTIRVADYIFDRISELGAKHIFMLTGGGAMFLNDAVAKNKNLSAICVHHEQAAAMGAVGYSKYENDYGVVCTTTGCGSTNTITGLLEAWQDNVKCIFISGQVNKDQTSYMSETPLRQFGVQEADIVEIVKSITKYAVMITDPEMVAYHLDKAFHLCSTGRPGPVWIDVPLDVQGAYVDPQKLKRYMPAVENSKVDLKDFYTLLENSKRPILLAGNGIKLSGATSEFLQFVKKHNIPVVSTYLGIDLLSHQDPLMIGCVGVKGTRAGNFALQNSDLVIAIGTRLSVPVIGYKYHFFAREAKIVVVDIDPAEHQKKTININTFIHADAKDFFNACTLENITKPVQSQKWADTCYSWKNNWTVYQKEYEKDDTGINLYYFIEKLSDCMHSDSVVVSDAGSAYYVTSQGLKIKDKQKYVTSGAQADMGFTIPASVGVSFANNKKDVIGITGDGSFQTNIQELQTIVHYNLPIKLFIWNNDGYLSIQNTQNKFFDGRLIGVDKDSGVSFPKIEKIAKAYGIKYFKVEKAKNISKTISEVLQCTEPVICEVMCQKQQQILPTLASMKTDDGKIISKPLEDMYPYMDREEFYDNMIVSPLEEK